MTFSPLFRAIFNARTATYWLVFLLLGQQGIRAQSYQVTRIVVPSNFSMYALNSRGQIVGAISELLTSIEFDLRPKRRLA